jgi:uncharacterized LabA/DUF88 family protein
MQTTFGIRSGARVETIIDGWYLYSVCRSLNFDVDFEALRQIICTEYDCRRMSYLIKVLYDDEGEIVQPSVARLLDYLRFNGYRTVLGEAKDWTDSGGRRTVKNSVDVSMALAMLQAARHVDELIIVSGSEELAEVSEECARMGTRVTLLASVRVSLSTELRSTVDWFVDIAEIKDKILRRERENPTNTIGNLDAAVVIDDRAARTRFRNSRSQVD